MLHWPELPGRRTKDAGMSETMTVRAHRALFTQMAETLGIDLTEAEMRGNLSSEDREGLVMHCTGCRAPGACKAWLELNPEADEPPSFCRNSDELKALR
ncbi:MAG: hypothetical protein ACI81Q_001285 [Paracoccaceae bacterium]